MVGGRDAVSRGLYRPDHTAPELHAPGPGAYRAEAGRPISFAIGGPLDVASAVEEDGTTVADPHFDETIPDGSGRLTGGGMGDVGWIAHLDGHGRLRWIAPMWESNPFLGVRSEGTAAVVANDRRNLLTLDLADPALA